MTQTDISAWSRTLQIKLMAALDAAWAILEASDDPAEIRRARDKAKACGDLAAVVRKVAQITPAGRARPEAEAAPDGQAAAQARAQLDILIAEARQAMELAQTPPAAAQVEQARRALDKLKGGRRGRP